MNFFKSIFFKFMQTFTEYRKVSIFDIFCILVWFTLFLPPIIKYGLLVALPIAIILGSLQGLISSYLTKTFASTN